MKTFNGQEHILLYCFDLKFPKELNLNEGLDPRVYVWKKGEEEKTSSRKNLNFYHKGHLPSFFYFIISFIILVEANSTCLITKQLQYEKEQKKGLTKRKDDGRSWAPMFHHCVLKKIAFSHFGGLGVPIQMSHSIFQ
jgi:hypothetical protein